MASGDARAARTDLGEGGAVVLLDWTPWASTTLRDALSGTFRVVDMVLPSGPTGNSTVNEAAAAIEESVRNLGLSSIALVGTSLGSRLCVELVLRSSLHISSMVVVSPDLIGGNSAVPWETPDLAARAMLAHPDDAPLPPQDRTELLSNLAGEWSAEGKEHIGQLHNIGCATLVVLGQEDRLAAREAGHPWKERVPNCAVIYVYDAGHAVGVDRPEALANVVLDFIERRETFIVENRSGLITP